MRPGPPGALCPSRAPDRLALRPPPDRGVSSRAVALACTFAFEELGLRRMEILADPDNGPSRRVAVRNGFTEAGIRDGRVLYVADAEPRAGGRAR